MQNYREETQFGKPFCCDVFKAAQRASVVHLNFRAGSTLVPVCTVSLGHWVKKADTQ